MLNAVDDDIYINQLENTVDLFQERIAELELAREDIGWVRLGGESSYEFSFDFLKKIIARSRLFFLRNPLINRGVSLQSDYVFGQGVNIQGTNDIVNSVVQEFLDDPQNKREFTSHVARLQKEQTLMLDGNVFFVLFTDKTNSGAVQIRSILVDEITEIVTNPDDSNEVWFYKREWTSDSRDSSSKTVNIKRNVVYYPDINYMPILGRLPRTRYEKPIYWDAPILHVKTGGLAKSRMGVPETYSALDWANAHRKMLEDWATIISMLARYSFKVTTAGNKDSVVAAKRKLSTTVSATSSVEKNPPTTAGGLFIRSKEGTDIEPIKTNGATTSAQDSRQLRLMVASALGLPDPMLSGEVDTGNLATAQTLDRPTELKFRSRQKLWEDVTLEILNWVIRWAIEAPNGLLSKDVSISFDNRGKKVFKPKNDPKTGKPIDLHIEVTFPPVLEHSIQDRINAITGAVTLNGKTFSLNSPELKKLTIRLMLQALGVSDVDEHVELIFNTIIEDQPVDPGTNNDPGVNNDNGNAPKREISI